MEAGLIKGKPRTEMERIIKGEQGRRSSTGPIDKKKKKKKKRTKATTTKTAVFVFVCF